MRERFGGRERQVRQKSDLEDRKGHPDHQRHRSHGQLQGDLPLDALYGPGPLHRGEQGVTTIGNYAFSSDFESEDEEDEETPPEIITSSVSLPSTLTSIGNYAFSGVL